MHKALLVRERALSCNGVIAKMCSKIIEPKLRTIIYIGLERCTDMARRSLVEKEWSTSENQLHSSSQR